MCLLVCLISPLFVCASAALPFYFSSHLRIRLSSLNFTTNQSDRWELCCFFPGPLSSMSLKRWRPVTSDISDMSSFVPQSTYTHTHTYIPRCHSNLMMRSYDWMVEVEMCMCCDCHSVLHWFWLTCNQPTAVITIFDEYWAEVIS